MQKYFTKSHWISAILLFSALPNFAFGDVDHQKLSKKVIELRGQVEALNDEYKTEREKVLSEIKALSIQKAELMSNVRNEEIRQEQLLEKKMKLQKELSASGVENEKLKPLVLSYLDKIEIKINTGLPFKRFERLQSVKDLRQKIDKKEISAIKAANQLWAMVEDEKRLAQDTSLHKQTISVDGKMQLAEVVKLGMLRLYFKTESGRVGIAEQKGPEWVFTAFNDKTKEEQIMVFMESLKKQIRQGYFELPTSSRGEG